MIRESVRGKIIGDMQPSKRGRFYRDNGDPEGSWFEGESDEEIKEKALRYWKNDWYMQEYYADGCEMRIFWNP